MANPQLEDGRTEIANELAEALARIYLSPRESRVLWAILRKTYGWHKKTDRISFTQFENLTGMNRRHIADALHRLIERKIVTRSGNNYKLEYGLQKDYELWESLPIEATKPIVTDSGNTPLPIVATKSLPIVANTKAKSIYTKAKEEEGTTSLEEYVNSLRTDQRFTNLNLDEEVEKFRLYWSEGGRTLKRPNFVFLNWLVKAKSIKDSGNHNRQPRGKLPSGDEITDSLKRMGVGE